MGGDSLCLCPCCSVLSSTTGQHVCRCYHTSNLQPLSAAPGARERLIYGASQAWGGGLFVCAVMQEQHVGVYTQEGFRLSCQLQSQVLRSAWFRTPYSLSEGWC